MRSITLIPATESDLDRIDLCRGYIDDLVKSDLYDLASATRKAKKEIDEILKRSTASFMLCFEEEKEEVGHILMNITPTDLFIFNMEVYEEFRGQGYGKAILLAVEQLAVEKDLNRMTLSVSPLNKRALKLYKNSGFSELFVHMEKRL